jgi:hypothetical protein
LFVLGSYNQSPLNLSSTQDIYVGIVSAFHRVVSVFVHISL